MQEGSLRCDANVNLHIDREGEIPIATPIVEIKNLNSFRGVEAAIEHELRRQADEFARTGRKLGDPGVEKETRGWDADRGVTFAQRGKEEASDYRYFPDPDLVPVTVTESEIAAVRESLCELPAARRARFQSELGLSEYDASVIVNHSRACADYFETVAAGCGDAKQAANWVTQHVLREVNERKTGIAEFPIGPDVLGALLRRIVDGTIYVKSGGEAFAALLSEADAGTVAAPESVDRLIEQRDLKIVRDTGTLEAAIAAAIADSPRAAEDFRAGKQQAIGPLVGRVMKQVKGADAKIVRELLITRLTGQ
jgi:aspartyl-tRNA(Asn)/glutamyl-tRNA(Gln) amidotransferase subunit B